ncbi:hypothetical protein AKJ16_DCAP00212 [Drosera capensis]
MERCGNRSAIEELARQSDVKRADGFISWADQPNQGNMLIEELVMELDGKWFTRRPIQGSRIGLVWFTLLVENCYKHESTMWMNFYVPSSILKLWLPAFTPILTLLDASTRFTVILAQVDTPQKAAGGLWLCMIKVNEKVPVDSSVFKDLDLSLKVVKSVNQECFLVLGYYFISEMDAERRPAS